MDSDAQTIKRKHTKNACDACRARKIKCKTVGEALECESCLQLNVPCTRIQPRKRRGPPSRYVSQLNLEQQNQTASPLQIPAVLLSTPPSGLTSYLSRDVVNLESLAPMSIIKQIIDDWFELVHPVAPILHRSTFLYELHRYDSNHDRDFTSLVISVCAAAVSTLPRRIMAYAPMITVERCHQLIEMNEEPQNPYRTSLIRCQWKYNLSAALLYKQGFDSPIIRLITAEINSMVAHIVHYELAEMTLLDQELAKRLFWLLYAGSCTYGLHGRFFMTPVNPFIPNDALRPRELLDTELGSQYEDQDGWQGNIISYIPGLNALSKLFMLWHRSQLSDTTDLMHLEKHLNLALGSLDNLPPALRWRGGLSRPPQSNFGTDVQMVNLYITQINIRAFLLDQMHNAARDSHNESSVSSIFQSRQNLVNDMLAIVYQMPEETLEANGHSLIAKLRDIGLALLTDSDTSSSAPTNLNRLLAKLDRLDVCRTNTVDSTSPLSHMTSPSIQI